MAGDPPLATTAPEAFRVPVVKTELISKQPEPPSPFQLFSIRIMKLQLLRLLILLLTIAGLKRLCILYSTCQHRQIIFSIAVALENRKDQGNICQFTTSKWHSMHHVMQYFTNFVYPCVWQHISRHQVLRCQGRHGMQDTEPVIYLVVVDRPE